MTVLHWIKNNKPWRQYVLTRVQEIREGTTPESWNVCSSERNPADIPSRGMNASELVVESKWWKGPEFLFKLEPDWLQDQLTTETDEPALSELVKNPPETTHVLTSSEEHSTEISL